MQRQTPASRLLVSAAVIVAAASGFGCDQRAAAQAVGSTSAPAFSSAELLGIGQQIDAKGIKFGSFMIFPAASLGMGWDSNTFATNAGRRGDAIYRGDAEVSIASNWSRHALHAYVAGGANLHNDYSSENTGWLRSGVSGRLDVYRDLYVRAFADFSLRPEERGTGETFLDFERMIYTTTAKYGGYVHKAFNRVWTEMGASSAAQLFDDARLKESNGRVAAEIDQSFRDGIRSELFGRVGYEISPFTSVFVETAYRQNDYNGSQFDADGYHAMGGVRYEFSTLTVGEFAAGYLHYDLGPASGQAALDTYTYRGNLSYALTPLITLKLLGSRDLGTPSVYSGLSERVSSEIGTAAHYAILRDLTLSAGFTYSRAEYLGLNRQDDTYRLSFGAQYYLNSNASLFAKFDHTEFVSGSPQPAAGVNAGFVRDLALAGVRLRY